MAQREIHGRQAKIMPGDVLAHPALFGVPDSENGNKRTKINRLHPLLGPIKEARSWQVGKATLHLVRYEDGRSELSTAIDGYSIAVSAIPATRLTPHDIDLIGKARGSYRQMWIGSDLPENIVGVDTTDAFTPNKFSERTTHYIVRISRNGDEEQGNERRGRSEERIVTMKQTVFPAEQEFAGLDINALANPSETQMPGDIAMWDIHNAADGSTSPLWRTFLQHAQTELGRLPTFSYISRLGSYPFEARHQDAQERNLQREQTAVGFSLINTLMQENSPTDYVLFLVPPEMPHDIFGIQPDSTKDFFQTPYCPQAFETLQFPPTSTAHINKAHPSATELMVHAPGYWLNNGDLGVALTEAVKEGVVSRKELQAALRKADREIEDKRKISKDLNRRNYPFTNYDTWVQFLATPEGSLADFDFQALAGLASFAATKRYAKYLHPILRDNTTFREEHVFKDVGDGPICIIVPQGPWQTSHEKQVATFAEKYGDDVTPVQ